MVEWENEAGTVINSSQKKLVCEAIPINAERHEDYSCMENVKQGSYDSRIKVSRLMKGSAATLVGKTCYPNMPLSSTRTHRCSPHSKWKFQLLMIIWSMAKWSRDVQVQHDQACSGSVPPPPSKNSTDNSMGTPAIATFYIQIHVNSSCSKLTACARPSSIFLSQFGAYWLAQGIHIFFDACLVHYSAKQACRH